MKKAPCPVCGDPNTVHYDTDGLNYHFGCESCGRYGLSGLLYFNDKLNVGDEERFRIRCLLAERKLKGLPDVFLSEASTYSGGAIARINVKEFAGQFPQQPLEYFDRAILNLSRIVEHPTSTFVVSPRLFPLCFSRDFNETMGILGELIDQGLLRWIEAKGSALYFTAKGWEGVAKLQAPGKDSRRAFVAMWFDKARDVFFDQGFKPAIEDDGKTKAIRIDRKETNQKIDDEIVAEIRRSRYVVADFTGNRGGVYFEAGFALGLGLPVIWCVQKDYEKELHFDTRQYSHIVYSDTEDLKTRLLNRIRATNV